MKGYEMNSINNRINESKVKRKIEKYKERKYRMRKNETENEENKEKQKKEKNKYSEKILYCAGKNILEQKMEKNTQLSRKEEKNEVV